jgi:serine phosphatase RsbU (regulator of sigma subunit)
MKSYGWRTWGDALREMALGALVGCAILIFEEGGQSRFPGGPAFARNALIGICIVFLSRGLETAMSWAIEQSRIPTTFRAIVYTVGGLLGYFLGVMLASFAFGFEARDFDTESFHFAYVIGIVPVLSILIGLILHHNRKRNDRLRASIERLKEHEFAEKELEIARSMQQRLLPPPEIDRDGYRVSARTQAAHLVGGDFYDVFSLPDGAVAILAADVSGKGIAASLLMASCKATVPFLAASGSAAEVMSALNAKLFDQLERREFVAMVFGRFEPDTGNLELVNAGMPDPFVTRKDGHVRALSFTGDRLPLGAMRNTRYQSTRITLWPGDRLLMFSDGLPEAMVGGVPVGYERIEEYVRSSRSVDELLEKVRGTESVRIEDDVTVVMLERHSNAGVFTPQETASHR